MKKFVVTLCLIAMGLPVFADIINPNLSPKQIEERRQKRQEMYENRTRITTIRRVCGDNIDDFSKCKKLLKTDYDKTIKYLNKYIESNKNDEKNPKNASN